MQTTLTPEKVKFIVDNYEILPIRKMAESTGVSFGTMGGWINKVRTLGLITKTKPYAKKKRNTISLDSLSLRKQYRKRYAKLSKEETEKSLRLMIEAWDKVETYNELAGLLGLKPHTIIVWRSKLAKMGLDLPSKRMSNSYKGIFAKIAKEFGGKEQV